MSATSLKLPDDLKRRIAKLAASSGQTPHAFMIDALAREAGRPELLSECVGNDGDVPKAMPGSYATVRRFRIPTRAQPLYFARTQGSRPKLCP